MSFFKTLLTVIIVLFVTVCILFIAYVIFRIGLTRGKAEAEKKSELNKEAENKKSQKEKEIEETDSSTLVNQSNNATLHSQRKRQLKSSYRRKSYATVKEFLGEGSSGTGGETAE